MNRDLEILLRLEGLVLMRKGLELAGPCLEGTSLESLAQKINKLRRQLPGPLLSVYDRLAKQYADPLAMLSDGVCQGCHRAVSTRLAVLAARSNHILECERCGRLIFTKKDAPDYVS